MYLMNYLVDFNDRDGAFSGDRTTPPGGGPARSSLFTSKNWLKLLPSAGVPEPPDPFPAAFNPDAGNWDNLNDMDSGTILINSATGGAPKDDSLGLRIGLDPDSAATPGLKAAPPVVTIMLCFGRPSLAKQKRASPFEMGGTARTTFTQTFNAPTGADSLGNPTWFMPIDFIRFRGGLKNHRSNPYEFALGVIMTANRVVHHYSHDPQMDVGL